MDLKIPSAMVERQMFPKQTNRTEMGSGVEAIMGTLFTCVVKGVCNARGNSGLE